MRERFFNLLSTILFVLITVIIFRDFFTKNLIPFPSNLLVSFYQPWESYYEQGIPSFYQQQWNTIKDAIALQLKYELIAT